MIKWHIKWSRDQNEFIATINSKTNKLIKREHQNNWFCIWPRLMLDVLYGLGLQFIYNVLNILMININSVNCISYFQTCH